MSQLLPWIVPILVQRPFAVDSGSLRLGGWYPTTLSVFSPLSGLHICYGWLVQVACVVVFRIRKRLSVSLWSPPISLAPRLLVDWPLEILLLWLWVSCLGSDSLYLVGPVIQSLTGCGVLPFCFQLTAAVVQLYFYLLIAALAKPFCSLLTAAVVPVHCTAAVVPY